MPSEVHANHVEGFNSSLRRYLSAFRRRTNTYAKNIFGLQRVLDIFWMVHNFVRPHLSQVKLFSKLSREILGVSERKTGQFLAASLGKAQLSTLY